MKGTVLKRFLGDVKFILVIGVSLGSLWLVCDVLFGAFCPSMVFLGLPCPGCGMTRALISFFAGRWEESWQYNPMTLLWLACGGYFAFMRYVKGKKAKGIIALIILLSVLSLVVFAVRMYLYFPGQEPLAYHGGNLLEKLLPVYGVWMEGLIGGL